MFGSQALYEKLLVEIPLAGFFLSKLLSRKGFSTEFHHLDSLDHELCHNLLYLKNFKGDVQDLGLDFTVLQSDLGKNTVSEAVVLSIFIEAHLEFLLITWSKYCISQAFVEYIVITN